MPFLDERAPSGGFLPTQDLRVKKEEEGSGFTDVAKIGAVAGMGVGLIAAPLPTLGVMAAVGGGSLAADKRGREAAFRTENTVGSILSDRSGKYTGDYDPNYDPWEDIAGTEFEPYWENFATSRNAEHSDIIKQDIIRERKDKQYLESQGMLGFAQQMAAGLFDLPSLLPGGAVVRTAKGASRLRTALKVGGFGLAGAGITEAALQATQELRTPEESAMNIAGATILSGVLGYGMASRMNAAELAALGKRVEQDFTPPDRNAATPSTEPKTSIPREMDDLEKELRQTLAQVGPHDNSIALQLQDELIRIDPSKVTRDELYGISDEMGDYRGQHRAPDVESGSPIHDVTSNGIYPDDFYSPNGLRYYGTGNDVLDQKAYDKIQSLRGKPNAKITVYRAVPYEPTIADQLETLEKQMSAYMRRKTLPPEASGMKGSDWYDAAYAKREELRNSKEQPTAELEITPGDWVAINREYAKDHGESALNGKYKIISQSVRAKDLFTAGDSFQEWGWSPHEKGRKLYSLRNDDGGDFGIPARRGLSGEGDETPGTRDVPAGERPAAEIAAGQREATPRGGRKPVSGTETFPIEGFTGVRTAEIPDPGQIAARVYRIYPEGVKVNRLKSPKKSLGEPLGEVKLSQHEDGRWEVASVEVKEGARRQKIATRLYDQIEADLGIKMRPSGWLRDDGFRFWSNRNPESVKFHRFSKSHGFHMSPKQIKGQLDEANRVLATGHPDPDYVQQWLRERDELQSLWDNLPAEAKTKPALDQMFALRRAQKTITDTPEFKKWFKGSKVVDENGEPLVVYHGTKEAFEAFDPEEAHYSTSGFWFSNSSRYAKWLAKGGSFDPKIRNFAVMDVYLKMENPYYADILEEGKVQAERLGYNEPESIKAAEEYIRDEDGYNTFVESILRENPENDGVILLGTLDGHDNVTDQYIVRSPTQIKAATGNRGTFDPTDPRIAYSLRGFYSPAIRAAENLTQNKGTGEQFLKQIMKAPGVRKDELEWMGLEEFLKDKKSVTKDEVLSFMRAHQVELDERILGSSEVSDASTMAHENFERDFADNSETFNEWLYDAAHTPAMRNAYVARYGEDAFEDADPTEIIRAIEGDAALSRYRHEAWGQFQNDYIETATRETDEAADEEGVHATKYSAYKVTGGENYREILIRLPELGQYESPHFQDQEIVHLRIDDRTGPNGEKILFINEVQSDLHQKGRKKGYIGEGESFVKLQRRRDEIVEQRANIVRKLDREGRLDKPTQVEEQEWQRLTNDLVEINTAMDNKANAVPNAPFKGDLWLELALKRALLYAAENGYDAVSWARSDQIAKAVGGDAKALSVQYDQKIGRFLNKYTKKWGGKVEEAAGVVERSEEPNLPDRLALVVEDYGGTIDAALRQMPDSMAAERQQLEAFRDQATKMRPGGTNPILRITPEMHSSVVEGQPFGGLRRGPEGKLVAEAKFEPEKQLITISRAALDPLNNLHHEALHALKSRGLFTPQEWLLLSETAQSKGWLDTPVIKDYEKVYGRSLDDESIIEEAIAIAYQRHVKGDEIQKGALAKVFERIRAYLERTANYIRSRGFNTAEDIFRAIEQGEIGARATPEGRHGVSPIFTAAGAQTAQEGDIRLKSAFGAEKSLAFLSPSMRLQNSPSRAARAWVAELAETALTYEDHKSWIPTARGGAELGQPGSVETRVKLYDTNIAAGFKALDDLFIKYRKGSAKRIPGELTVTSLRDVTAGPPAGKMDYRQFREAVSFAMRRGDAHDIPEVAEAAKTLRKEVFDPLLQRAIELELLPEDVTPETAASYLNRTYNKERIVAERTEFRDVITKWLQENEIHNAQVRGRLSDLVETYDAATKEIKLIDNRLKARAKRHLERARAGKEIDAGKATARDASDNQLLNEQKAIISDLRDRIETEIESYRGKTADEAKSALKARRKEEAGRKEGAERLASADKPVLKAARKIAAQTEKENIELIDTAEQIIDRILGTPEGRLPYDSHLNKSPGRNYGGVEMDVRGPLNAREFMIPDARIEQWLENDMDLLLRAYVHTMAPDIELTARFGSPDMVLQFKQINEEYARMAAATDDPKIRKRLHEQKKEDFLNLGAIRDRLRGTYALPDNPDSITVRAIRGMMTLNYMRMLGGMTISALPDVSRFIHVQGVTRTFGDGIIPMFRNFARYKKAGDETKWLSGALEMVTDNRAMRIADITDTFGRHTKFERAIQSASRQFGMVSLMAPWNSIMKQVAGTVTQTRILRGAERLFAGKPLKQKEIEYFADLGISQDALRKIGEQFKKHGAKENNVWSANTAQWDEGSRTAIEALRVGLRKEVDRAIVTPSLGERPRFASTLMGSMLLQFKSFAISATQKMLISGLQQKDMNALNAAVLAVALGGLVHILKGAVSGRPVDIDWGNDEDVKQFLGNAFDRSGMAGVLMEFNNIAEKVTDGRLGLSALTGKPISRYASRNITASLIGPAFGLAEDSFKALNAALGTREWVERDSHNVRQLMPLNNLFYLRSAFDKTEEAVNDYFGVREKAR